MPPTKDELEQTIDALRLENEELRENADQRIAEENETLQADNAKLQARLEEGLDTPEEIPEHGHSIHESRSERQNRLRSGHMETELQQIAG